MKFNHGVFTKIITISILCSLILVFIYLFGIKWAGYNIDNIKHTSVIFAFLGVYYTVLFNSFEVSKI